MRDPQFIVGEDVFVRDPQRFLPDCTCIVGPVARIDTTDQGHAYEIDAAIGRIGGGYSAKMSFAERDIGHRPGTPLSQLSGRPGRPGYDQFKAIAASWGHD